MDSDFFFNRWLAPIIVTLLFFLFIRYRKQVCERIGGKNKQRQELAAFLSHGLRLDVGDYRKTIVLPAAAAIGLLLANAWFFQVPLRAEGFPLWFSIPFSGFLNPVSEEFLCRGILLGMVAYLVFHFTAAQKVTGQTKLIKHAAYATAILLVSLLFTNSHQNTPPIQFTSRFLASILYGLLYYANHRNLLPPIAAHAAANLLLITTETLQQ